MSLSFPPDRTAIKICGLTNEQDARAAIAAGADLLGFNTWTGSKRYLDLAQHEEWIWSLPVGRVALLVNAPLEEAARIAALPYIDALQLHGDEDAAYCAAAAGWGKPIIKALRVREAAHFADAASFSTPHLLLDAHVPGAFGGTGVRIEGSLVHEFLVRYPNLKLWLAGGLVPENVGAIVASTRPLVADVSSGVEAVPGRKDIAKMEAFCEAVRAQK